jgi:hypothetical protein
VYALKEVLEMSVITLRSNAENGLQIAKPTVASRLDVPVPSYSFPDFHCLTKPVVSNLQLGFRFSSSRPLPHQCKNEQRLQQEQDNATKDVPLIQFPGGRLPVQHHAARRKVAFL